MTAPLLTGIKELERLEREIASLSRNDYGPLHISRDELLEEIGPRLCAALREAVELLRVVVEYDDAGVPLDEKYVAQARAFLARMGVET